MGIAQVELKIDWAQRHFEFLRAEVFEYVKTDPCKFRIERYSPLHDKAWGRFIAEPDFPECVPLMIGDVLQSTHSSLDYLICELVRVGKEEPGISNQFPITESRGLFEEEIGRKRLRGVPFDAITVIERLQPYNTGQHANESPLFALKTLTNRHKHRNLLVAALAARQAPADIQVMKIDGVTYAQAPLSILENPFDFNAEIGPFEVVGTQVKMEGYFASVVAFSEALPYKGREVTSLVGWICRSVRDDIIPQFSRFF